MAGMSHGRVPNMPGQRFAKFKISSKYPRAEGMNMGGLHMLLNMPE